MLYLLFAFLAGVLSLAAAQVLASRLHRYQVQRARLAEARVAERLRAQGWTSPLPTHPDWMSDYGYQRTR